MIRAMKLSLIVALATIFSCHHIKKHLGMQEEATGIEGADKIEYTHHGPAVAPPYHRSYTITLTPANLVLRVTSYSDVLLTKKRPFTKENFEKVVDDFKNLKKEDEPEPGEIPVGGGSDAIVFYKDGKELFKGAAYGGRAKNFSGGDISLSYLVPDLDSLIASTKK